MVVQGIPEEMQRERPQAPPQTQTQTSPPPPPASPTTQRSVPSAGGVTADEAVNLFEAAAQAGSGQASAGRGARGGAQAGAEPGQLGNLDFLRNNPHFQQLRMLVQQQPQMLEPILQQVGAGNPQLAQLIGQNQEQFLQLLSEDFDDDAQLPPGTQAISVTEEERDAIERVCLDIFFLVSSEHANMRTSPLLLSSSAALALIETLSFRPTSLAIRTKNLLPIFCSTNPMKAMSNKVLLGRYIPNTKLVEFTYHLMF